MKAVHIVLGIGTAIIVSALIGLGISAFYPAPTYPSYPTNVYNTTQCDSRTTPPCTTDQQTQYDQEQQQQAAYTKAEQDYTDAIAVYDRNFFIIANVIGAIVFAVGFWLIYATALAAQSVPIGIMVAGLWAMIYGYTEGWNSVDDKLKFVIGLVLAIVILGGSMWLIQRQQVKNKTNPNV